MLVIGRKEEYEGESMLRTIVKEECNRKRKIIV